MKIPLFLCLLLASFLFSAASQANPGPLRILYLGKEETPAAQHCASLMQELGREAIWFDYVADPAQVSAAWYARFDAVVCDAPEGFFPPCESQLLGKWVTLTFGKESSTWTSADFIESVREQLLVAAGGLRRAEWEGFLADRQPESRGSDENVANYERRPSPVRFQVPMSVQASMQRTQVPIDCRLEIFASEPDISKPIALAWDERGRLWVAETRDYPHGVTPGGEGNDDIKICEDTDGDGRADKFTVFADHLNLPTSLVFTNGGVVVAQAPRFLFLKDTDGDDKADVRRTIMESWGVNDTHAQASNLHYGYDNWLHGCVGYSGFRGEVRGKMHDFRMGTFRFQPDGSALEFLHQFSNNSWAQSQNAAGDDFGGTANNAPIFYGGLPARLGAAGKLMMSGKAINLEEKAHPIFPNFRQVDVFGGYTAAAGSSFIYSANLPPRFQGKAMICEPTMKIISLMDVQQAGAGYVAKDGFNLVASSDEWMSPVFAEVGPDGAVWFADWQNFIIQHNPTPSLEHGGYAAKTGLGGAHENPLRDHSRGRIYRVVWEDARPPKIASLREASSPALVEALKSDTQFWRLTAQRLLVENKKADAVDALKDVAVSHEGTEAVHALWSLEGLGALDVTTCGEALRSSDPVVRRTAARTLPMTSAGEDLLLSSTLLLDEDPIVRLAALVKLGDLPTTQNVRGALRKLGRDLKSQNDEWLKEAMKLVAKKHGVANHSEGPNLLSNGGLEPPNSQQIPNGWERFDLDEQPGTKRAVWTLVTDPKQLHRGTQAIRCQLRGWGRTTLRSTVTVKPHTKYRLSAWVRAQTFDGSISVKEVAGSSETEKVSGKESGWMEVDTVFSSATEAQTAIQLVVEGEGEAFFDDIKLAEILDPAAEDLTQTGDSQRGEQIFYKHPSVSCVLCHSLKGQGSAVGPALDGLAKRHDPKYIVESLLEPNKVLASGYEKLGISPMPPLGLILNAQELADLQSFLQTLR